MRAFKYLSHMQTNEPSISSPVEQLFEGICSRQIQHEYSFAKREREIPHKNQLQRE